MPPLSRALLATTLLSVAAVVLTAPATSGKVASPKASSLRAQAKSLTADKKLLLRRGKRQVVFDDVVGEEDAPDEAIMRQQLAQMSDGELAALADIVRDEIDRYAEPEYVAVPQYEVIEIPDEYLQEASVLEPFPRDRRSIPSDWVAAAAAANVEQELSEPYILVPEEAVIEALEEEQDEQELRDRIAEIAQILNERATRRARFF